MISERFLGLFAFIAPIVSIVAAGVVAWRCKQHYANKLADARRDQLHSNNAYFAAGVFAHLAKTHPEQWEVLAEKLVLVPPEEAFRLAQQLVNGQLDAYWSRYDRPR